MLLGWILDIMMDKRHVTATYCSMFETDYLMIKYRGLKCRIITLTYQEGILLALTIRINVYVISEM